MNAYDDKALLFITSTDARIPQGRNARAQHRAKTASQTAPATKGEFGTLECRAGDDEDAKVQARKRQKRCRLLPKVDSALTRKQPIEQTILNHQRGTSIRSMDSGWSLPFINPAEILSVATFHIRRMTTMSTQSERDGLTNLLRRRQWSCVPYAYNCFGKDPCVDSAVLCVADRIRFLSGSPFSPVSMMRHYEKALKDLQTALDEPEKHHPQDILAAVQLLAVYEMLDSMDNESWSKHVAGAATMIQAYTTITPESLAKWESRGCGHALPMFSDALMKGDVKFFRRYPWRELLWAIYAKVPDPPDGVLDLMQCSRLMPSLLLEVDSALKNEVDMGDDTRYALLDRAHDLHHRTTAALTGNRLYTTCNYQDMLSTFDLLGAFLSGLVALDRIIAALTPPQLTLPEAENDETGQLCAQLLQLELGAMVQYPPTEVLAGFQHASASYARFDTGLSAKS